MVAFGICFVSASGLRRRSPTIPREELLLSQRSVDDCGAGAYRVRPMIDKAARDYLASSGASAISIVEGEAGCAFRTGAMAAQAAGVHVHTTVWVSASVATAIARRARKLAGDSPDVATATEAAGPGRR